MIKQTKSLDEYLLKQSISTLTTEEGLSNLFRGLLEPV